MVLGNPKFIYWQEEHATAKKHYHIIDPSGFFSQMDIYKKIKDICEKIYKNKGCFFRNSDRTISFTVVDKKSRKTLLRISCPLQRNRKTGKWVNKVHISSNSTEHFDQLIKNLNARKTDNSEGYMFNYM